MEQDNNYRDIFAEMMAEPRPHRIIDIPRNNPKTGQPYGQIALVVLTAEESAAVIANAERKVRAILKDAIPGKADASQGYDELFKTFCSYGILLRACKQADLPTRAFFPNEESIGKVFNVDELGVMLNHYYTMAIEMGPVIAQLSEQEQEAWLKRMVEGGTQGRFLLNSFSLEALKELMLYMANQLRILQMAKSSSGSQPESGTSTETSKPENLS